MPKLIYTPKALEDLQGIKNYVTRQFGGDKAKIGVKEITSAARYLEIFPDEGPSLEDLINNPTDYRYLVVRPNYIFYRIEGDTVRVIRILNEKQDFLQILFGISSVSEEGEEYWNKIDDDRSFN
ncbi:MAG: type II toxin-antitoxin system RelE/ParE family toxin [Acetatifactor sp.]|nr:type II toxin-antitoxin system RelE/ParE family toxin [Acetatifactor sp.]